MPKPNDAIEALGRAVDAQKKQREAASLVAEQIAEQRRESAKENPNGTTDTAR